MLDLQGPTVEFALVGTGVISDPQNPVSRDGCPAQALKGKGVVWRIGPNNIFGRTSRAVVQNNNAAAW